MRYFSILLIFLACFYSENLKAEIFDEKSDLIDYLKIQPEGASFKERLTKSGSYRDLVLSLQINADHNEIKGYISLEPNYLIAKKWLIVMGDDTIEEKRSSSVFINLDKGQKAGIIMTLEEPDLSLKNGLEIFFIPAQLYEKERLLLYVSQSVFAGILVFLLLFNLILSAVTRWQVYFRYAVYIFFSLLYMLYYFGLLHQFFPNHQLIPVNAVSILFPLLFVAYFWFILSLGDYANSSPEAAKYLRIGIWYQLMQIGVELIFYAFGIYLQRFDVYTYFLLFFEIILIGMIVFFILKSGDLRGKLVIVGSSILILAGILAQIDTGYDRAYILEAGILIELLLYSIGLGYLTKQYYQQKTRSQTLYLRELEKNEQIQKDLQRKLEKQVADRTAELIRKNHQNEELLKEVNHRVKNNLQIISSMLQLQLRRMSPNDNKNEITKALSRIQSIGLIHEHLYRDENILEIDLNSYINDLCKMLSNLHDGQNCSIEKDISEKSITMDKAIVLGIILNELVVNSFKYAKSDSEQLRLFLKIESISDEIRLSLRDNGVQIKGEFKKGFGFQIIENLVSDKDAIQIESSRDGFFVGLVI